VKVLLEILHISLISRDFFFDNPLFFRFLPLFTTKKNRETEQHLQSPEPLRGALFPSSVSVGATTHKPFI